MTTRIRGEEVFLLRDLGKKIGRSYQTIRSYIIEGRLSQSGQRVHLETYRDGSGWTASSVEAWERFLENLQE